MNAFHRFCIVNGDGGVIAQRLQKEKFAVAEVIEHAVDELNHAQRAVLGAQRHADHRAGSPLRHVIDSLGKARIGVNVGHN